MPVTVKKSPDPGKQIRVSTKTHEQFSKRAASLGNERGRTKPLSLPEYLEEASAFFETNRPRAKK